MDDTTLGPGTRWPRTRPVRVASPDAPEAEPRDLEAQARWLVEQARAKALADEDRRFGTDLASRRRVAKGRDAVADAWASLLQWTLWGAALGVVVALFVREVRP